MQQDSTIRMRRASRGLAVLCVAAALLASGQWGARAVGLVEITSPSAGDIEPGSVRIAGSAPAGSAVEVFEATRGSLGTTTASSSGGRWSVTASLPAGARTVYAKATDATGESVSPSVTFEVDTQRPGVVVSSPRDGTVYQPGQAVEFTGLATDDRGVYAVTLEYWLLSKLVKHELASCSTCGIARQAEWTHTPQLPVAGYYHVRVHSFDLAGNMSTTTKVAFLTTNVSSLPVNPPGAPPVPSILNPRPGSVQPGASGPITVTGRTEPGSTVQIYESVAGKGWLGRTVGDSQTGVWTFQVRLTSGVYGIQARAIDESGNRSVLGAKITFWVDGLKPTLQIETESLPDVFLPTEQVKLEGAVSDNRRVLAVQLEYWLLDRMVLRDNAACPSCANQHAALWTHTPELPYPGYYYVKITAIDIAGNRSTTQVTTFVETV